MNDLRKYLSVGLYCIYIFLVGWSDAARKTDGWSPILFQGLSVIVLLFMLLTIGASMIHNIDIYRKYGWQIVLWLLIIGFLAIALNSISIVMPMLIGVSAVGASDRLISKIIVTSLSLMLLFSTGMSIAGMVGGDYVSKPLLGNDNANQSLVSSLGMSNPNGVMMIFITVSVLTIFLCKTRAEARIATAVLLAVSILLSYITGSTTGLVVGIFAIALAYNSHKKTVITQMGHRVVSCTFIAVTIITFIIAIMFGPVDKLPNPVNDILTTRPYTWNLRIENKSYINLYGSNDVYSKTKIAPYDGSEDKQSLDNMPLFLMVQCGIIVYLMFVYIFYLGSKSIRSPVILSYVVVICLLTMVERMYLFSFVFIFLLKSIIESKLQRMELKEVQL